MGESARDNSLTGAPDALVQSGNISVSVAELRHRAACAATGFAAMGMSDGDVVAAVLRNDLPLLELMLAGPLAGVYVAPVNWHLQPPEVAAILTDCQPKLIVIHADLLVALAAALPVGVPLLVVPTPDHLAATYQIEPERCQLPPGAVAWQAWRDRFLPWTAPARALRTSLIYTSGTTGTPKGVCRFITDPAANAPIAAGHRAVFGLRPGAVALMTGPLYHSAPNAYALGCLALGASLILMPRFDPADLLALISRHRITHMHMVPTMFVRLDRLPDEVKRRHDLSSLAYVIHGAAPCPPEIKRRMIDWWGEVIHEYYGSTETSLVTVIAAGEALARPGSVGRAVAQAELRVLDGAGQAVPPGTIGEVFVRNAAGARFAYFGDPSLKAEVERDGWITNGDIGYLDDAGYLYLCDRAKEMIISGGVNIFPSEIEAVILGYPNVGDCAVFGIPDQEFGEAVAAAIELDNPERPLDIDALKGFLATTLARYKVPRRIDVHDHLPRVDTGKIYKRRLRAPFWRQRARNI